MPTYEYECMICGYRFQTFQKITDKPLRKCSLCHGKLQRLIGAGSGLIFKGSGFYATDYKKKDVPPKDTKETATTPSSNQCSSCSSQTCSRPPEEKIPDKKSKEGV